MSALFDDTDLETQADTGRGLPDLIGSEKQQVWAGHIRRKAYREMDQLLREWARLVESYRASGKDEAADREAQLRAEAVDVMGRLEQETRSWWWISAREFSARELLSGRQPERSGYWRQSNV